MGTPPQIPELAPPPLLDDKAEKEAVGISSGKLKRDESLRKHMHAGSLILFWFMVAAIIATSSVWLFNELAPTKWRFLDAVEETKIQGLIIAALGSSFVTNRIKNMVEKTQE